MYEEIKEKGNSKNYILLSAMYPESDDEIKQWNISNDWDCKERYRFEYITINKKHEEIINKYKQFHEIEIFLSENSKTPTKIKVNDFIENYDENHYYKL